MTSDTKKAQGVFTAEDFDNREFYEECQSYRHTPLSVQDDVVRAYKELRELVAQQAQAKIAPLVAENEGFRKLVSLPLLKDRIAERERALKAEAELTALKAKLEVCAEQIHVALAALTDGDNHWHAQNEILTATRPCTACEAKARIEELGRKA